MHPKLAVALVVLTSASVLVLEILANRLVAPFVGLTLETTTASIGVALAGIAAGSALGGRLADDVDPRRWLGPAIALGGVLLLLARPTVLAIGGALGFGPFATVVLVAVAVGPAALVLTTVTPGVIKLRLQRLEETGQTVGRLSAAGTLGALAGTFLTGFVLLNALPTSVVLLAVGLLLVATGLGLGVVLGRRPSRAATVGTVVLALLGSVVLVGQQDPCDRETRYYCADVRADIAQRPSGRALVLDGLRHSVVDLADPTYLDLAYAQRMGDLLATLPAGPLDVLHIGLGAGTLPRHVAALRPGSTGRVLEVDPGVLELAQERLGLVTGPDLRVRVGDARTSISEEPTGAYDVVVGDAFGGLAVPWHLTTREMVREVRRTLRPGGVYLLNVIDNPPSRFAAAKTATLREAFGEVVLLGTDAQASGERGGNFVLAASDAPLSRGELDRLGALRDPVWRVRDTASLARGAQVLTDDDAPVDQLLTPYAVRDQPTR